MLVGLMSGIAWSELLSASPGPRIPPEPVRAGSTVGQGGHPVNRVIKRNAHYLLRQNRPNSSMRAMTGR